MLYLVGLGLGGYEGLTLEGIEALKRCDKVFLEAYTDMIGRDTCAKVEKIIKKKIRILCRKEVEDERIILEEADKKDVALIVGGDPLIATTHVSLLIAAKKRGIETSVVHASSIITAAVGESGLQVSRFGRLVSIPKWTGNYRPTSPYDFISENLARNLHTLVLLDLDESGEHLTPKEALLELLEMEKEKRRGVITDQTKVLLLSNIGRQNKRLIFASVSALVNGNEQDGLPSALIIPASLHFLEEEFLRNFFEPWFVE
ncbi:MAG: diphthine synthase [Candidatus Anstonellales archaeon]